MSDNNGFSWEDENEEAEDFRDIPEEVKIKDVKDVSKFYTENPPPAIPRPQAPIKQQVQEMQNEEVQVESEEEEIDDSEALSDARLRLSQGELYAIIMKHDLFEGVDADPRALKNVQREIRKFAKERMEIMLGMRQEKAAQESAEYVSSPFNPLEVEILKRLASKATNGATETEEATKSVAPRNTALKPISGGVKPGLATKSAAKLPSKPAAPIRREAPQPQGAEPKLLTGKQLHEMNEQEKAEFLEKKRVEIAERQAARKSAKPTGGIPLPTPEQEEALHAHRIASDSAQVGTVKNILALIEKQKKN